MWKPGVNLQVRFRISVRIKVEDKELPFPPGLIE
jgi:hypothetical protein